MHLIGLYLQKCGIRSTGNSHNEISKHFNKFIQVLIRTAGSQFCSWIKTKVYEVVVKALICTRKRIVRNQLSSLRQNVCPCNIKHKETCRENCTIMFGGRGVVEFHFKLVNTEPLRLRDLGIKPSLESKGKVGLSRQLSLIDESDVRVFFSPEV